MSKLENRLKNQDIDYEEILNNLNIGYYRGELQGKLIKHNKALNKILGYDISESLIGTKASDFLINEEEKTKYYNGLLEKGFVQNLPIHIKDNNDNILVLQVNSHIVRDDREVPLFIEGTFVDITEKFKMEQKLKESEINKTKRVKELTCLYGMSKLVENPDLSLEDIIQRTLDLIPPAWQYPEITCALIKFRNKMFKTDNFQETKWVLKSDIKVRGELKGSIEIYYLKEKPDIEEGPFMKEERILIDAITERLGRITERIESEEKLKRIEWLLKPRSFEKEHYVPNYGDLTRLNNEGIIKTSVEKNILMDFTSDFLDLLETSSAIYERNGDYALGIFSSNWCRFLDQASRDLCNTNNNKEALESGKWLCHESCWTQASKKSVETGQDINIECNGGLHLYSVPIRAENEIVGSINFGYGDPPEDQEELKKIAEKYKVSVNDLSELSYYNETRPQFITDLAKKQIKRIARMIGYIIERKKAEEKTIESERKYKDLSHELETILDIIPGMMFCKDKNGKVTRVNKIFADALKLKKEEIIGRTAFDLFPKEQADAFHSDDLEVINTGKSKLNIEETADFPGRKIYSITQKVPLTNDQGDIVGVTGLAIDITERKRMEQELRASEEKYHQLIETAQLGIWIIDINAYTTYVNKKMEEILGYTESEMIGKHLFSFMDEKEIENAKFRLDRRKHGIKESHDFVFLKKDGSKVIMSLETSPSFDKNGNYNGAVAFIADITDRKKAEKELIDLAKFPSENPNPVLRVTKERILYVNSAGQDLFDTKEGERIPEILIFYINDCFSKNIDQNFEITLNDKVFSFTITPINDAEYANLYGIDITELKKIEKDLKESEKRYREAYDKANFYKELIAHDMNNILHTIHSSVELYGLYKKSSENIKYQKEVFDIISRSVFRGSSLVSNIIKLSEIEETKIPTKIIEAKRILDKSIEHINQSYQGLNLNIKVETDLIKIYLKANELLSDLFENLLVNAVKHNENPEIEIQIKISEEISNEIKYIKFEFADNGIGIPDESKQELFEKNLARKSSKKGLGIGLSLVKQIISSYNGTIHIENRVDGDYKKGSNFIVLIPEAD